MSGKQVSNGQVVDFRRSRQAEGDRHRLTGEELVRCPFCNKMGVLSGQVIVHRQVNLGYVWKVQVECKLPRPAARSFPSPFHPGLREWQFNSWNGGVICVNAKTRALALIEAYRAMKIQGGEA